MIPVEGLSWHQFTSLPHISKLPLQEQIREYDIYNQTLIQEVLFQQQYLNQVVSVPNEVGGGEKNIYFPISITATFATASDACTEITNNNFTLGYIPNDTVVEIGNYVYSDEVLLTPLSEGWFGYATDGNVYFVTGSEGLITTSSVC